MIITFSLSELKIYPLVTKYVMYYRLKNKYSIDSDNMYIDFFDQNYATDFFLPRVLYTFKKETI